MAGLLLVLNIYFFSAIPNNIGLLLLGLDKNEPLDSSPSIIGPSRLTELEESDISYELERLYDCGCGAQIELN